MGFLAYFPHIPIITIIGISGSRAVFGLAFTLMPDDTYRDMRTGEIKTLTL